MSLDGPRAPARSGQTRQLVVLLHGYGADGADLFELHHHWRAALPDAAFVAPNAPQRCSLTPMGYQWFDLDPDRIRPDRVVDGVLSAAQTLDHFLDTELARHGVQSDALALVGFSQGAMMALHVGLRRT